MIKAKNVLIFTFLTLLFITPSTYAQPVKIITLKDGSQLKGQVISLNNGVYSIETSNIGRLDLHESDILSISSEDAVNNPNIQQGLKGQVQSIQGTVMNDPELLKDIEGLAQDPEVMKMLSDEALVQDIFSYDPERIQSNPKLQELMQNPKMQQLIEKVDHKHNQ